MPRRTLSDLLMLVRSHRRTSPSLAHDHCLTKLPKVLRRSCLYPTTATKPGAAVGVLCYGGLLLQSSRCRRTPSEINLDRPSVLAMQQSVSSPSELNITSVPASFQQHLAFFGGQLNTIIHSLTAEMFDYVNTDRFQVKPLFNCPP